MSERVVVDRGRCTGIGICESIDEEFFEVGDDGKLTLPNGEDVPPDRLDAVRDAVRSCPARALTLIRAE